MDRLDDQTGEIMKGSELTPICLYCQQPSKEVDGTAIYKHRPDLAHLHFYMCEPCDAYVGTHRGTRKPLGTLANANLRRLRNQAHTAFDPLWSNEGGMPRKAAYAWLAQSMGLRDDECHIAMFNEDQCRMTIKLCGERDSQ